MVRHTQTICRQQQVFGAWELKGYLWRDFIFLPVFSIVDFEQVNTGWEGSQIQCQ